MCPAAGQSVIGVVPGNGVLSEHLFFPVFPIIETINTVMRLYEFTGKTIEEMLAEIDRRGFLKGLGAATISGTVGSFASQAQAAQNKDKKEEFDSYDSKPFKIPADANGLYKFCVPSQVFQDGKLLITVTARYSLKEKNILYSARAFDVDSMKSDAMLFDYYAEDEDVNKFLSKMKAATSNIKTNKKLVPLSISHIIGLRALGSI